MTVTIAIDPSLQAQMIWSSDLNCFLRIYTVPMSEIQNDLSVAQAQLTAAQLSVQSIESAIALAPPQA